MRETVGGDLRAHPEDPGIECWGFDFIKIDWCGGGTLVMCDVPKGATHFVAMAGVDDNSPLKDVPVVFSVQVDGRPVAETRGLVAGERHLFAVPLEAGAKSIKLFSTAEKPVHVDWAGAGFTLNK